MPPDEVERWRDLYLASDRATPFQSPSWLLPLYNRHTRGEAWPIFAGPGFAPLLKRHQDVRLAGADYEDILCSPGREEEAVRALLGELSKRKDWRTLYFRALRGDSALLAGWSARSVGAMAWKVLPHRTHAIVNLPTTWAEYERQLGKKLAYKLRAAAGRRNRGFASNELRRATDETLEVDLDALFELHRARWRARGEAGVFGNDDETAAFREAAKQLLSDGSLWLYTLWLDGVAASALYCLVDRRAVYCYIGGIDTTFQKHHPGKVLIARAIKDAIALGLQQFDFLGGDEGYKDDWANGEETVYRLIAGRGLLGRASVQFGVPVLEWLRKRSERREAAKEATRAKTDPAGTLAE
jgi:CelD/BcsL family acetyltransferase involved in cellulose biosynthesis